MYMSCSFFASRIAIVLCLYLYMYFYRLAVNKSGSILKFGVKCHRTFTQPACHRDAPTLLMCCRRTWERSSASSSSSSIIINVNL